MEKQEIVYALCEYLFQHRDRRHVVLEIADALGLKENVDKAAIEKVAMPGWILNSEPNYDWTYRYIYNAAYRKTRKINKEESAMINTHSFNWDPSKCKDVTNQSVCHCGFRKKMLNYSQDPGNEFFIDDDHIAGEKYKSGEIFPCEWSVKESLEYRIQKYNEDTVEDIIT